MRTIILGACLSLSCATVWGADTRPDVFHALQRNSWYIQTDDNSARIFVTSLGSGPKVVTLHGGYGANFEYLVGAVERHIAHRQFIFFDQRGSLLSPYKGKMEDLSVDDLVDDLEKL